MRKTIIIGLVIVLAIGCLAFGVAAYVAATAVKDVTRQEFAPLNAVPSAPATSLPPGASAAGSESLRDVAYVKVHSTGYTDDADPQDDGLALDLTFYDSNSELLQFSGVPVQVTIRLYGYSDALEAIEEGNGELVYEASLVIDHSIRLGEMFGKYIRIPYDQILVDRQQYTQYGKLEVTILTPDGVTLSATSDIPAMLYPSP